MENKDQLKTLSVGGWQVGGARFQRCNVSDRADLQEYVFAIIAQKIIPFNLLFKLFKSENPFLH